MKMILPYDKKTISVEIPDQNFVGSLVSRVESYKPGKSQQELVESSLDNPIGSPKLEESVKGKKNIVIISSDHTRPVPSKIIYSHPAAPDPFSAARCQYQNPGRDRIPPAFNTTGISGQIRAGHRRSRGDRNAHFDG
jgi:Lactate racemase N-terminal domain